MLLTHTKNQAAIWFVSLAATNKTRMIKNNIYIYGLAAKHQKKKELKHINTNILGIRKP